MQLLSTQSDTTILVLTESSFNVDALLYAKWFLTLKNWQNNHQNNDGIKFFESKFLDFLSYVPLNDLMNIHFYSMFVVLFNKEFNVDAFLYVDCCQPLNIDKLINNSRCRLIQFTFLWFCDFVGGHNWKHLQSNYEVQFANAIGRKSHLLASFRCIQICKQIQDPEGETVIFIDLSKYTGI